MKQVGAKAHEADATLPSKARKIGRPRLAHAGEVEERILDAAIQAFLQRGLEGASLDLIAETARCGKPTIYARYANKQALFRAAVAQRLGRRNSRLERHKVEGGTVEERLVDIGVSIIEESLNEELVGLMRLAVAEARQFPDLARGAFQMARQRGQKTIGRLLKQCIEHWPDASKPEPEIQAAAQLFAEMILLPFLMRAFFESMGTLKEEIVSSVKTRVGFFLAALRNGGLNYTQAEAAAQPAEHKGLSKDDGEGSLDKARNFPSGG